MIAYKGRQFQKMQIEEGQILKGKVTGITKFGAFVELDSGVSGLVHISEVSLDYVNDINDHLKIGEIVEVKVLPSEKKGKIGLSIKQALKDKLPQGASEKKPFKKREPKRERSAPPDFSFPPAEVSFGFSGEELSFEDKLNKFKQVSDERMHDIKHSFESKRGTSRRGGNKY